MLGVKPLEAPSPAPAAKGTTKGQSKAQQAFQRGLAALAQGVEREGAHRPVPRKAVETLPDGTETKLGIWYSNTKARRDKLTEEQWSRSGSWASNGRNSCRPGRC